MNQFFLRDCLQELSFLLNYNKGNISISLVSFNQERNWQNSMMFEFCFVSWTHIDRRNTCVLEFRSKDEGRVLLLENRIVIWWDLLYTYTQNRKSIYLIQKDKKNIRWRFWGFSSFFTISASTWLEYSSRLIFFNMSYKRWNDKSINQSINRFMFSICWFIRFFE
jgi:hypothetical protein